MFSSKQIAAKQFSPAGVNTGMQRTLIRIFLVLSTLCTGGAASAAALIATRQQFAGVHYCAR